MKAPIGHAKRMREAQKQERIRKAAHALLDALEEFTEMYCQMINSGDCGNWDPESDKEVIKARAAIAAARGDL